MKKEWKQCWKVVYAEDSNTAKFTSAFLSVDDDGSVIYQVGKITQRKQDCGPLAVFATLEDARNFNKEMYSCVTLLSEYIESKDQKLWNKHEKCDFPLPKGTLFADKVRPIKIVE